MSETPDPGTTAPATYRFATAVPGALGYDTDELDRVIADTFEYGEQTVGLVINGTDEYKSKTIGDDDGSVALPIYAGSIFVVIDGTPTVTLTPAGGEWFFDPFEGGAFGPDHPVDQTELFLLEALHARLRELGEELPPLDELLDLDPDDAEEEVATDGGVADRPSWRTSPDDEHPCPIDGCPGEISPIPLTDRYLCDQSASHEWSKDELTFVDGDPHVEE